MFDWLMMSNAGSQYPYGIFYSPQIGGLPIPTGTAREFLVNRTLRVLAAGKKGTPNLCTPQGQQALVMALAGDYAMHKSDLNEYLVNNCNEIRRVLRNDRGFQTLSLAGAKAIINSEPEALKLANGDQKLLAAISNIVFSYFFDSEGGHFVFV